MFDHLTWQLVVYAVLSLTVVRMAPVAFALAGAKLGWATTAFIGWFGPRGLASVVFALLALEDLGGKVASPAAMVITATVLLNVIAHGASAEPLARRYGAASATPRGARIQPPCPRCRRAGSSAGLRGATPSRHRHRVRLTGERCSPARPVTVAAGTSPMEGDAGQWRRL